MPRYIAIAARSRLICPDVNPFLQLSVETSMLTESPVRHQKVQLETEGQRGRTSYVWGQAHFQGTSSGPQDIQILGLTEAGCVQRKQQREAGRS